MLILHRKIASVSKVSSVRELILISESDSKTFDNSPLTCHDVIIDGDGLAEGDTISYSFTGSQKWIGSSENTFTYSINNVSGTNYIVTCGYGELTVTDDDIDDALIVTMTTDGQEGSEDEIQYRLDDTVTFEISVRNPYEDTQTITLIEIEGVTLAADTFTNVAGGQTISTTATYTIMEDNIINGSFTNTVTASIENLTKTAECTILTEEPNGHLTVYKTTISNPANNEAYDLNETIRYEITVVNDGNLTITDIEVDDELCDVSWQIESLTPGEESTTFVTNATVTEQNILDGEVLNVATARGTSPNLDEPDVLVEPGEDPESTVDPNPDLSVSLYSINPPTNGTSYVEGETVHYTLRIQNRGNITITETELTDETSEAWYSFGAMSPGKSYERIHGCPIMATNIADGYFTIEGFVTGDSPDENNPDYSNTFAFQIPITPQ